MNTTEIEPTNEELDDLDLELDETNELDATAERGDEIKRLKLQEILDSKHKKQAEIELLRHEVTHSRFIVSRLLPSEECSTCSFPRRYHHKLIGANYYKGPGCKKFTKFEAGR